MKFKRKEEILGLVLEELTPATTARAKAKTLGSKNQTEKQKNRGG